MAITHTFISAIADGGDATLVRPVDNWNANHSGVQAIRKTADKTVTSSTALQDDDHLSFAIAANETWLFQAFLDYEAVDAEDIIVAFNAPAGAALSWSGHGKDIVGGATTDEINVLTQQTIDASLSYGGSAGIRTSIFIMGSVANGGTSGAFQLRWAQRVSGGTGTIVRAGSYLTALLA